MRTVGVIRRVAGVLGRGNDAGVALDIMFGQAVSSRFGGRGFQVVKVAVGLLVVRQAFSHVVEHPFGEFLRLFVGHILADPARVEAGFVHAHQTDGREVVIEGAEVALRVGIKAVFQQFGDDGPLDLKRARRNVHHMIKASEKVLFIGGQIGNAGHVDGDYADRAGAFAGAEEATGFLAQFAQIQPQTAAHRAHIAGLHVAVDIVGEVRCAVFGGHLEKEFVVLGFGPVEIAGDGIGRDRVLEAPAVGVALNHDFDEGLVDHIHFPLAVFVLEVGLFTAHNAVELGQIRRNDPVQRDVGEGCLRAPAGRGVYAVNEGFDGFFDLLIGKAVHLYKGGKIGVKGGECLCAGPFVLHDAKEVDHLIAKRGKVAGGGGSDLAGHAAKTLLNELFERPTGAVTGQHGKVVQMDIGVAVCLGDLLVIDLGKPVVGRDGAGVGKNEAAHRIGHGRVFFHAPVVDLEIVVHNLLVVQHGGADVAQFFALFAVENIGLGNVIVTGFDENRFHAVLNGLHTDFFFFDFGFKIRRDFQHQKINGVGVKLLLAGIER